MRADLRSELQLRQPETSRHIQTEVKLTLHVGPALIFSLTHKQPFVLFKSLFTTLLLFHISEKSGGGLLGGRTCPIWTLVVLCYLGTRPPEAQDQ